MSLVSVEAKVIPGICESLQHLGQGPVHPDSSSQALLSE